MKKFMYVLVNIENKEIVAIYSLETIANKMKPAIENKLDINLDLIKKQYDVDIKTIN